jgi:hypothetical protein
MSVIVFRSFLFVLPCAALLLLLLCHHHACALRVMTFNTWHYGTMVENGLQKIAKHINRLSPDIVSFQVWQWGYLFKIFSKFFHLLKKIFYIILK